jgi:hypothetical protein
LEHDFTAIMPKLRTRQCGLLNPVLSELLIQNGVADSRKIIGTGADVYSWGMQTLFFNPEVNVAAGEE